MKNSFEKIKQGYLSFRKKYAQDDHSVMHHLAQQGQHPEMMVIACCDSRVDPALILQCDPGELFVLRNVANIVPPFEKNQAHDGAKAALEYGICHLSVKHLIILAHSQCGGIQALLNNNSESSDFLKNWVSLIKIKNVQPHNANEYAKLALKQSYQHCLTYPWINERVKQGSLIIHLWFFDIDAGEVLAYSETQKDFVAL